MLEKYKEEQPTVYKVLSNAIKNGRCSHAYLFETNGYYNTNGLVFSFIKEMLCTKKKCDNCNICAMIDSGNYPEIKIIKPEGMWIKKEQLLELMEEFNTKALFGNKKIYVIYEAEKLNKSASNSILKFLEEPEENIIAILITNNMYQMLKTIISRCQVLSLRQVLPSMENLSTTKKIQTAFYNDIEINEEYKQKINKIINFPKYYEINHLDTIVYMQKLWHDYVKTKDEYLNAFSILIMYYKDVLNYKLNINITYFNDYINDIKEISLKNTTLQICNKLKTLLEYKEKIKFNVNTSLLMDRLIIAFESGE